MSYTNNLGISGKVIPNQVDLVSTSIVGQISHSGTSARNFGPFLPLADGDNGIRSVQSFKLSTGTGGGWGCLVLCKPIASFPLVDAGVISEQDFLKQFPSLPKVKDNAYLGFLLFTGAAVAAGTRIGGYVDFIW